MLQPANSVRKSAPVETTPEEVALDKRMGKVETDVAEMKGGIAAILSKLSEPDTKKAK